MKESLKVMVRPGRQGDIRVDTFQKCRYLRHLVIEHRDGPRKEKSYRNIRLTWDFQEMSLKEGGIATARAHDLFNSTKYRSITESAGYYSSWELQLRACQFLVTFSYLPSDAKIEDRNSDDGDCVDNSQAGTGTKGDFYAFSLNSDKIAGNYKRNVLI